VELIDDSGVLQGPNYRLHYDLEGNVKESPCFRICVRNTSQRTLYFALLCLTESFEILPLMEEGSVRLEHGQSLYPRGGKPICASLPRATLLRGGTETCDTLKVVVSTCEFDVRQLRQPELEDIWSPSPASDQTGKPLLVDLLHNRPQSRSLRGAPEASSIDDWLAVNIEITTVRPHDWVLVNGNEAELAAGVRLAGPRGFSAHARLNSELPASEVVPPALGGDEPDSAPFRFLESCGSDPGLGVLELDSYSGIEFVTRRDPICISHNVVLRPGEQVVPFAFDGGLYVPLGRSEIIEGTTLILVDQLPVVAQHSANGLLRIRFHRSYTGSAPRDEESWRALQ
jgi:hypothetical protein